jgi:hypothetical protein
MWVFCLSGEWVREAFGRSAGSKTGYLLPSPFDVALVCLACEILLVVAVHRETDNKSSISSLAQLTHPTSNRLVESIQTNNYSVSGGSPETAFRILRQDNHHRPNSKLHQLIRLFDRVSR